jgi:hypothetical protein
MRNRTEGRDHAKKLNWKGPNMPLNAGLPRIAGLIFAIALGSLAIRAAHADEVVVNKRYPISKNLSPPNVEATNECAVSVYVSGFVPHATIKVILNGASLIGGPVAPKFGYAAITLTGPLHQGDRVTATQTVNGVASQPSAPMVVGAMPNTLPVPVVDPPIYACGGVVPVGGLVSGVQVEVRDTSAGVTVGTGATPNGWGNDWAPVVTSSLVAGHQIEARQSSCTGVVSPYSNSQAVDADPSPIGAPLLDPPVVGNDAIGARNLLVGADLRAYNGGTLIGSGFATGPANTMGVWPRIVAGEVVTADQALCATSPKSPPATAVDHLTPPTLVGPICPGQKGVIVAATTINATLVLIKNAGLIVGYGGAGPGDVDLNLAPPNSFAANDKVRVVEYIGGLIATSNTVKVGCHDVITYHNDNGRTGWNANETILTPADVKKPGGFGWIATAKLDDDNDQIDGQPLIVTNQKIDGAGVHSVVYVATENDSVYAFDSFTGARLKKANLGTPVPRPLNCENNGDVVGINSTPTIDRKAGVLYLVAYVMQGMTPIHQLHMLDLATLQDKIPPVTISATNTLADGSSFPFDSSVQRQRAALLQANGNVYAGFASFCDARAAKSRGWVMGWGQSNLTPLANTPLLSKTVASSTFDCYVFMPWTSNHPCYLASVWMSGYGIASDASGSLFFTTGNTGMTKPSGGVSFYDSANDVADTMIKMAPDLNKIVDFFTPWDVSNLDQTDSDFGSGGTMVLPDQPGPTPRLAVAAGKDGYLYIVNRETGSMGGFQNPNVPARVHIGGDCHCGPSYYKGSDGIGRVVTSGGPDLVQWTIDTANRPALSQEAQVPFASGQDGGGFTSISSNGTTANTAILWAVGRPMSNADVRVTLYAFDATASSGALTPLWHGYAGSWPNTGGNANIVPTVANGMVYVASNKEVQIFGLTRPPITRKRMTQETARAVPAAKSMVPDAAPIHWGIIRAVDRSEITLELRDGRKVSVDISKIMPQATSDFAAIGRSLAVGGPIDESGVLRATAAWRVKGPAFYGPDRER